MKENYNIKFIILIVVAFLLIFTISILGFRLNIHSNIDNAYFYSILTGLVGAIFLGAIKHYIDIHTWIKHVNDNKLRKYIDNSWNQIRENSELIRSEDNELRNIAKILCFHNKIFVESYDGSENEKKLINEYNKYLIKVIKREKQDPTQP